MGRVTLFLSSFVPAALLTALAGAPGVGAQEAGFPVVVFEGQGQGHGVGLALDGAHALAEAEGAGADEILERFYPGTQKGTGKGLVRLLMAAQDDVTSGIDVLLPQGGTVRDGRTTPVAASFPIRVPAGRTVRITYRQGFYRAEVLDEGSVSGTVEITATSAPETGAQGPTSTAPALAASERSLWIEARRDGPVVFPDRSDAGGPSTRGPVEIVVEAERMHAVAELDVETYLLGLNLSLPGGAPLAPAALQAGMIAARTYAVRAASAEPKVGRFNLYADERSLPYVGPDDAPTGTAGAAEVTSGRVVTSGGAPIAALVTVSAGGETASPSEVFGGADDAFPYLVRTDYPGGEEFAWRVEMRLDDVARRLGYAGDAESLAIIATGPSGRPSALRVSGSGGSLDVRVPDVNDALRLPSSRFQLRLESRTEALPERTDSPAFQELPPTPGESPDVAVPASDDGGGNDRLPLIIVAVAGASLVVAFLVLMIADIQRRLRAARERRASRKRHPTQGPAPAADTAPEPATEPATEPEPVEAPTAVPGPVWHNEPEWLTELAPPGTEAPDLHDDLDLDALRRETHRALPPEQRLAEEPPGDEDEEPPETRPLSEVLGWDDAPSWLDEPDRRPKRPKKQPQPPEPPGTD